MRGGFRTKEEALAAMHSLQRTIRSGDYVAPSNETLNQRFEAWIAGRRHEIRDVSRINFRTDINRILPLLGHIPLQSLSKRIIKTAYDALADRGYKATTIQKTHSVLKCVLQHAVEERLMMHNPAQGAFKLRIKLEETQSLTESEVDALLASERGNKEYPAERLMVVTGLRPGELCALRSQDVDLDTGSLVVAQAMTHKLARPDEAGPRTRIEPDDPKTPAGRRRLELDHETVEDLRAYRAAQLKQQEAMGAAWRDQGYFFAEADGRPWRPDNLSAKFRRRIQTRIGRQVRLYALRHTAASIAHDNGASLKEVSVQLGHASLRSTYRYVHIQRGSGSRTGLIVASALGKSARKPLSEDIGTRAEVS